jgi:hypothetical protein
MSSRKLGEATNDYLRRQKKGWLDPEIESLVYALNDTGVVDTIYSCQGHFSLGPGSFCHHNQKAQIHFHVIDLEKASSLCEDILSTVLFDDLDVTVQQYVVKGEDDFEIQWSLEYRPIEYWCINPQDQGVYVAISERWNEKRVRGLLREAFDKTIEVCRKYQKSNKGKRLSGKIR